MQDNPVESVYDFEDEEIKIKRFVTIDGRYGSIEILEIDSQYEQAHIAQRHHWGTPEWSACPDRGS